MTPQQTQTLIASAKAVQTANRKALLRREKETRLVSAAVSNASS